LNAASDAFERHPDLVVARVDDDPQKPKPLPAEYGADLRDMCLRMLAKNPDDRPTARELIRSNARLREACALALRDAGVTRDATAAVGCVLPIAVAPVPAVAHDR
jgi:hypothetical protein